jgi:hypothetical protein
MIRKHPAVSLAFFATIIWLTIANCAFSTASEVKPSAEIDSGKPLVQLAILLDTSSSMEGMIKQAQTQLWAIVNEFATASRDKVKPELQVALYQYGTPSLGASNGYIRQILPLTTDLDKVSEELFKLTTNGGDEYCGWVIQEATEKLAWSPNNNDYKAIFIAGNEPFDQGKVNFRDACKAAVTKGIIVNTIHCAGAEDRLWDEGARLADGRFMKIDGNRMVVEVKAPQDAELTKLNAELNKTYLSFGGRVAGESKARQEAMDSKSAGISNSNLAQRVASKASAQYKNASWDLIDALREKKIKLEEVKEEDLPTELRNLTMDERKGYVERKEKERSDLQAQIQKLAKERETYVATEIRKSTDANKDTLGEKMKNVIREQAVKRSFSFSE